MKRFVSVFILAAVLLASFASCGTKEEADTAARFESGEVYSTTTEEYGDCGVLLKKTFSKEDGRVETTEYPDGFVYAVCYDPTPYYPNGYQAEELAHLN